MDLTARVEALEEEVSVLKNEIKTILQEVRVAILARDNPFLVDSVEAQDFTTPPTPFRLAPEPEEEQQPLALHALPPQAPSIAPEPAPVSAPVARTAPQSVEDASEATARRWTRQDMATFMDWAQNVTRRFGRRELAIMLGISRHGGLISAGLEETLLQLGETLGIPESKPALLRDFLLSLRELESLQPEASDTNSSRYVA